MEQDSQTQGLIKWMLGVAGLGAVAAPLGVPKYGLWISLAIVLLLVLLVGGYWFWQNRKQKREQRQFANALQQESAAAPRGISDPNRRAKLDDLRRRFQEGVTVYESRGKDLYKLPWAVFIGEPGSGKTEAIRRSNIGFPPGLQDEFQGAGGTVNMNWWFSNHGVLLDTAGRLIFEEVKPGESSEWKEFLNLLRKTRPFCPINGLFLVLPVDSLIKDSAEVIAQKAGRIAQQLDVIQRTLDIRFPVYVLVTKCDLLTGFREFFDGLDDPQLQHQMLGWSNPEPLDAPFRMDLVDQYLTQVAERLRRRRLALLRDPVGGADVGGKRADEVDALYALPQSMMLIAPRLRRYLETIFVAGEWSAKPVFLRGIYFTSSLREGGDLDEALAQALGVPVAELPGGRVWQRDRAFFLRDLFVEKAFRERGLVTRATNTGRMLRNRKLALFGCGFAAIAVWLLWSWLGWRDLNESVGQESVFWQMGTNGWTQGTWNPIVRPGLKDPLIFQYAGHEPVAGGRRIALEEYHHQLMSLASSPLPIRWVFRPITWLRPKQELDRKQGQRILFERGVLQPLLDNTRQKMTDLGKRATNAAISDDAAKRHWAALLALIQLEADLTFERKFIDGTNGAGKYLQALLNYLTETNQPPPRNLVETFAWTYSPAPGGQGIWPPSRFSGGDSLAANTAIDQGLQQFLIYAKQSQKVQADRLKLLNSIRDQTAEFQRQEALLHRTAEQKQPVTADQIESLTVAKNAIHYSLLEAKYLSMARDTGFSLALAYTNLIAESQQTSTNTVGEIYRILAAGTKPVTTGMFSEIRNRLAAFQSRNVEEILLSLRLATNVADFDRNFLADCEASRYFAVRWDLYQQAFNYRQSQASIPDLVGQQWRPLEDFKKTEDALRAKVAAYQGGYKKELSATCDYLLDDSRRFATQRMVEQYVRFVTDQLNRFGTNSASAINIDTLQAAKGFLEKVDLDLAGQALVRVAPREQSKLAPLQAKAEAVKTDLIQKYIRSRDSALGQMMGFPVALDNQDRILNLGELQTLRAGIGSLEKDFATPTLSYYPRGPFQSLKKKVSMFAPLLGALVGEDRTPRVCKVVVDPSQSDKTSRFRWVTMTLGDKSPVTKEISGSAQDFGALSLDQGLKVEVRKFMPETGKPNDPETKPVNQGDEFWLWGPLELIRKYQAKSTRSVDGRTWHIGIPVGDDQQKGVITVVLTFDQPLPPLDEWPKKQTWNQL